MYKFITCMALTALLLFSFEFDAEHRATPYETLPMSESVESESLGQAVYSFDGVGNTFSVSDGLVKLNLDIDSTLPEEIQFGTLMLTDTLTGAASHHFHLYLMIGDDTKYTLGEGTVSANGEQAISLGSASTEGTVLDAKTMPPNSLIGNLYLDLTSTDASGIATTETLALNVVQVNSDTSVA